MQLPWEKGHRPVTTTFLHHPQPPRPCLKIFIRWQVVRKIQPRVKEKPGSFFPCNSNVMK